MYQDFYSVTFGERYLFGGSKTVGVHGQTEVLSLGGCCLALPDKEATPTIFLNTAKCLGVYISSIDIVNWR